MRAPSGARACRFAAATALSAMSAVDALAHSASEHRAGDPVALGWSIEPWVVVPLVVSVALYASGIARMWRHAGVGRGISVAQSLLFAAGVLVLVGALMSPLDALGAHLFSAHMVQHEVLMLIAAPLLVMARPLAAWSWALPHRMRSSLPALTHRRSLVAVWGTITSPLGAWLLHAAALWVWHIPSLMGLALSNEGWHAAQHASFLGTALLFWWSTVGGDARASKRGVAFLSLFTTMVHTGALGALLTFGSRPWYPEYASTTSAYGLDPLDDQQLGGLVMWIPGGVAYLVAALVIIGTMLGRAGVRAPASTPG